MSPTTYTIREIVSTQASAAAVLQRFDIDLCAHAGNSLEQACGELQLSVDQVLEKLADAAAREQGAPSVDVSHYTMTRLIQHIVRTHHQTVRRELPQLAVMAEKLALKHGGRMPELRSIRLLVEALRGEMFAHLEKEEQVLFPFITQMEGGLHGGTEARACFQTVAHPIAMMVREHEGAESVLAEIARITDNFKLPEQVCMTHIALYTGLAMFQADLKEHVHLENDLLFPRAIEAESKLPARRPVCQ